MSVAVTHSYANRLGPPTKPPTVRKGGPLPLLLDAFPVPPNHSSPSSPSASSPSFPVASTSTLSSSSSIVLPVLTRPPTGPLPPLPTSATSKPTMNGTPRNTRSVSPDISTIIESNASIKRSTPRQKSSSSTPRGSVSSHESATTLNSEELEDSGNESGGSESSIDIHTPLPHLMVREGLLSPNSKAVASLSRTASPAMSRVSLVSMDSTATTMEERERRKMRHRNGKVLRDGLGLTTGLGWSDSEDEDEGRLNLMNRLSKHSSSSSLRSKAYPASIRSAPASSAVFAGIGSRPISTLSRSTSSTSSGHSTTSYAAFSVQKPTSVFSRSHSDRGISTTASDGSTTPTTVSSVPSRKPKSRLAAPGRPRLASIGEASLKSKASVDDDLGRKTPSADPDVYGRHGFNYALPRSSSRNSTTSPTLSAGPSPISPILKSQSIPKQPAIIPKPVTIPKPPASLPGAVRPKFRHNMDARVKRLEDKMASLQNYAPPPGEGDSDTEKEKDERSRTPTPQSPGEELSTDSAGSAGPLTPSDSRGLISLSSRLGKSSDSSLGASDTSGDATPHSAPATLSRRPSKIRPLITASPNYTYTASSPPKSAPEVGSKVPRSRTPVRPPPSPASLPPTSVEYAKLHPLTTRLSPQASSAVSPLGRSGIARSPARTSSLHPLTSIPSPAGSSKPLSSMLAYSPHSEVGLASFPARTGTGMVYRRADNGDPVASGSVGRLGVGKLAPKKATLVYGGGLGAGGVDRV